MPAKYYRFGNMSTPRREVKYRPSGCATLFSLAAAVAVFTLWGWILFTLWTGG